MTSDIASSPLVSVVLAVRNEASYLPRCLEALVRQTYPHDRLEVIVADGGSADGSEEIACGFGGGSLPVRVLHNAASTAPAGFNVGIRAAAGEVIIILGARAEVASDFVEESVSALQRTGAAAVGGVVESRAWAATETATARAIALALRSPFGVGDARYRHATREQEADTVNYGAYRREVFERVGLFDESMTWVEDDEFNYRLRAAGGRLVLSPAIRVRYYARPGLAALWRQQFRWGMNKPKVARRHPAQMRPRHAVPALFVGTVLVTGLAAPFVRPARWLLAAVLGAYALAASGATVHTARRPIPPTRFSKGKGEAGSRPDPKPWFLSSLGEGSRERSAPLSFRGEVEGEVSTAEWPTLVRLPFAFATMHVAYGSGMLLGLGRAAWQIVVQRGDAG